MLTLTTLLEETSVCKELVSIGEWRKKGCLKKSVKIRLLRGAGYEISIRYL